MKLLILIALPTGVGGYILLRSNVGCNFLRNRIQPIAFLVTNMQYLVMLSGLSGCIRINPQRLRNTVDCCFGFRYEMGCRPRLSFLDELQVLIGIEVLSVLEIYCLRVAEWLSSCTSQPFHANVSLDPDSFTWSGVWSKPSMCGSWPM